MQIIDNWLSGKQNFMIGASLYKTIGTDQKLKDLLAKGETPTAKRLLVDALKKMNEPGNVISLPEKVEKPVAEKVDIEMLSSDDPILESLKQEWLAPYQRMNLLRHQLDKFGDDNGWEAMAYRQPRAREIRELEQKCMAIWAKRDYYIKEGKLPFFQEKQIDIPSDPVELAGLITKTKKYITRYSKAMRDNPENPRNAELYVFYKTKHLQVTGKEYIENKKAQDRAKKN